MASKSRRYLEARSKVDRDKHHPLSESVRMVKDLATAKFDETVEMCILLGVNPRDSEQVVRGTCVLPNGTGRSVRVLALVRGEHADDAREAGADYVGDEEYVKKIEEGWLDFEVVVATPDMMRDIGKLGRVLGPRGLMPSPKTGTLTEDVSKAVREAKAGKISFRVDRQGNLHAPIGKASFEPEALEQNAMTLVEKVTQLRPSSAKGPYLRRAAVSSTIGPGVKIDVSDLRSRLQERGVR
jgi:large subunit ribosomal protein L1